MMNNIKRQLTVILAVIMLISVIPVCSYASPVNYNIDENGIIWRLDSKGVLTVKDPVCIATEGMPWLSRRDEVKKLVIETGVKTIEYSAFRGFRNLEEIVLPTNVGVIGSDAFSETPYYNNKNNWTDGVLYIGTNLIKAKVSLSGNYEIRANTTCIAASAFANCTHLTDVKIPESTTFIPITAFYNCTSLKNVIIPNSIKSIGSSAFESCTALYSIALPAGITSIGLDAFKNTAYFKDSSKRVNGILYIGDALIDASKASGSCYIKKGTTCIADGAFLSGAVTSVTIPDGVKKISRYTFMNCRSLKTVIIPASVTQIDSSSFNNSTIKIICVKDSFAHKYASQQKIPFAFSAAKLSKASTPRCTKRTVNSITLSFNKTSDASGYQIYRFNEKSGKYEWLKSTASNVFTDTGLKQNTNYCYKIRAYIRLYNGTYSYGSFSYHCYTYTDIEAPALKAAASANAVKLTWTKVEGANGYRLYKYNPETKKYVPVVTTAGTAYTDSGLKTGAKCSYRVRAYKQLAYGTVYFGALSPIHTVKTLSK